MSPVLATFLLNVIDLGFLAVTAGLEAKNNYEIHMAKVKIMVIEERDPTEEEKSALTASIAALREQLHAPEPD